MPSVPNITPAQLASVQEQPVVEPTVGNLVTSAGAALAGGTAGSDPQSATQELQSGSGAQSSNAQNGDTVVAADTLMAPVTTTAQPSGGGFAGGSGAASPALGTGGGVSAASGVGQGAGDLTGATTPAPIDATSSSVAAPVTSSPSPDVTSETARGPPATYGPVLIDAATGGSINAGAATLTFAPGSLPADAYVSVTVANASVSGLTAASAEYDLKAVNAATGQLIEQFASPPQLSINVGPAATAPEQIYYLPPSGAPVPIASTVNASTGIVSAGLPHFSTYVVAAGVWTITLDSTAPHSAVLSVDNSNLVLTLDGTVTQTEAISSVTRIVVTAAGSTQNDTLTLDVSGGAIPVPVTFTGGSATNTLVIPELLGATSWTRTGTSLTGTSAVGDFQPISATGVQELSLDPSVANTLTGPNTASTWSVLGTQIVSVDGLTASGIGAIASGSGTRSDMLDTPTPVTAGSLAGTARWWGSPTAEQTNLGRRQPAPAALRGVRRRLTAARRGTNAGRTMFGTSAVRDEQSWTTSAATLWLDVTSTVVQLMRSS